MLSGSRSTVTVGAIEDDGEFELGGSVEGIAVVEAIGDIGGGGTHSKWHSEVFSTSRTVKGAAVPENVSISGGGGTIDGKDSWCEDSEGGGGTICNASSL